jgi:hypothetical protein
MFQRVLQFYVLHPGFGLVNAKSKQIGPVDQRIFAKRNSLQEEFTYVL